MGKYKLKQHSKVKYLGCLLDERMSGKGMAVNLINKINNKLKFLHHIDGFLTPAVRHLLCTVLFWLCMFFMVSELTKKLKHRIQTTQNKFTCFCLQLDKSKDISHEESKAFKLVNCVL